MSAPETKAQRVRAVLELLEHAECGARDLTARLGLPQNKLRSVQRDLEELCLSGEVERFKYHPLQKASTVELAICFIELNPQNWPTHATRVNRLKRGDRPVVFRLARMRGAGVLNDLSVIPGDFHPVDQLSGGWGIMTGDPARAELFFSAAVAEAQGRGRALYG